MIRQIIVAVPTALHAGAAFAAPPGANPKVLGHSFPSLHEGAQQSLCQYGGKAVMLVDTASLCGYTRQYGKLVIIEIEGSLANE